MANTLGKRTHSMSENLEWLSYSIIIHSPISFKISYFSFTFKRKSCNTCWGTVRHFYNLLLLYTVHVCILVYKSNWKAKLFTTSYQDTWPERQMKTLLDTLKLSDTKFHSKTAFICITVSLLVISEGTTSWSAWLWESPLLMLASRAHRGGFQVRSCDPLL